VTKRLKILFGIRSPEHREVLRKLIQSQKDMAVVGEVHDSVEILLTVADTEAEVILLDLLDPNADPGICSHLLIEFPHLIIFALSKDRKHVVTYRLFAK
jgi:DNA-binding NarL/FixJ family response regulator